MIHIPGISNSGSMPINAGGPSAVSGDEEVNFTGGSVNFGGSTPTWLLLILVLGMFWFFVKGK